DLKDCVLGHGVSGVVRLAEHRESAEKYAIKTLSISASNLKKAYMSRNEVDTYLQLDHPTIVRLVDVFEDAEKVYIVMEFSSGNELYDQLINEKFLDEYRAKKLILQMLECVVYCHNKRICHRDIKLENWVYSNQKLNLVKLIDFGFSRTFSSNVPMTAMHGTIYYVSPEVMDGCYREKCDIWSIGVILYMVLSGKPPFTGNADYQILLRIKNNLYDFKGPVWNKVSAEAKEFIKLLLQPSPAERPSAREALQHRWLRNVTEETLSQLVRKLLETIFCQRLIDELLE
uniref:Calcium-dependent protein kinase 3-like n=1 Tax=Dermatophagoides pteronyssinus TaxID=6956 RepID=A0A6P6Y8S5_DERPT